MTRCTESAKAERVAHAVAAHRHEIREVPEERGEDVADERDAVVGQPEHQRVDRLAAGHADALEAPTAALERVGVGERDVGNGGLGERRELDVVAAREAGLTHHVGEERQRAPDAQTVDANVVGLARRDVRPAR